MKGICYQQMSFFAFSVAQYESKFKYQFNNDSINFPFFHTINQPICLSDNLQMHNMKPA